MEAAVSSRIRKAKEKLKDELEEEPDGEEPPKPQDDKKLYKTLAIILGIVGIDQLTKWLTVINLEEYETVPLWENVFHFTFYSGTLVFQT